MASSSGMKMARAIRLKKSCTVAIAKARRNCSLLPERPSATRVAVTVVPRLAPKSIGMAISMGRPPATMPTVIDVVVEEDCMIAVARIPMPRPTNGFCANEKSSSARSPAAIWKPAPIMLTALSSSHTATTTDIQSTKVLKGPPNGRKPSGSFLPASAPSGWCVNVVVAVSMLI